MWAHLPLALLCVATFSELLHFLPVRQAKFFGQVSLFLLILGVPAAWLSVYLGGIAEEVVNKVICDPTATHEHEDMAMLSSYVFSAALLLKFALLLSGDRLRELVTIVPLRIALVTGPLLMMLLGSFYLAYTGHLGANLVFNQGAGVYRTSQECREFE